MNKKRLVTREEIFFFFFLLSQVEFSLRGLSASSDVNQTHADGMP